MFYPSYNKFCKTKITAINQAEKEVKQSMPNSVAKTYGMCYRNKLLRKEYYKVCNLKVIGGCISYWSPDEPQSGGFANFRIRLNWQVRFWLVQVALLIYPVSSLAFQSGMYIHKDAFLNNPGVLLPHSKNQTPGQLPLQSVPATCRKLPYPGSKFLLFRVVCHS